MIVFFCYFFMKSYVVGTHYNHLVDEILICTTATFFIKNYAFSDSFYCKPFLLGDSFTKDSQDSTGKKKNTLTIIVCEEIIRGYLRED